MSTTRARKKLNSRAADIAVAAVADELEHLMADHTPKDWFSRLPEETMTALNEIRERYRSGKYAHLPLAQIWRHCKQRLALTVGVETFSTWLRKLDD